MAEPGARDIVFGRIPWYSDVEEVERRMVRLGFELVTSWDWQSGPTRTFSGTVEGVVVEVTATFKRIAGSPQLVEVEVSTDDDNGQGSFDVFERSLRNKYGEPDEDHVWDEPDLDRMIVWGDTDEGDDELVLARYNPDNRGGLRYRPGGGYDDVL